MWAGRRFVPRILPRASRPRLGVAGGQRGNCWSRSLPPPPAPAPGGARASRYLDQPQDVTAVGGGGRADHEFSHFRLLLFFPLRTRPLYLNSRRRWFLIRLPGASSSQSGWHHDLADLGKRRKSRSRLRLNLRALAAAGSRFLAQRSPASGCEAEAPRPMRSRPPPSSGRRLLFRASV